MNSAVIIRFLTPYISSITRDQDYVHSPLPLDGALAHAAYWEALMAGRVSDSPTGGQADPVLMQEHVTPALEAVFETVPLGELLGDDSITERVYAVSSGFPIVEDLLYIRRGARWVSLDTGDLLPVDYETQPIRKRVTLDRVSSLRLELVGERGRPLTRAPETGKGVLKAINNRVITWQVYEYLWLAEIRNPDRLRALLDVLKYQGMGKKRTAGFGKILDYEVIDKSELESRFPSLEVKRHLFLDLKQKLVLLRPLPYDIIMLVPGQVVMTNLIVESGCGYCPPYWSDRRVVVREGTLFRFLN
jgi:hypothetical protein